MKIISIDIGVKNIGLCELQVSGDQPDPGRGKLEITFWDVVDVFEGNGGDTGGMQAAIAGAARVMDAAATRSAGAGSGAPGERSSPWDCVVIENQPGLKNPRMKAVQIAIHTFLVLRFGDLVDVFLAGASGKTHVARRILEKAAAGRAEDPPPGPGTAPSADGSGAGATASQRYRQTKKLSVEAARAFLKSRGLAAHLDDLEKKAKKDDMTDALLQGLYYLERKAKVFRV